MSKQPTPTGEGNSPQATSLSEYVAQRTAQLSQPEETAPETETEELEQTESEQSEEVENEEIEEVESEEETEELEQAEGITDILSLTPEQLQELGRKSKSRLLSRVGELTAKNKALESQLHQVQADAKPLQAKVAVEDNPFRELKSLEEVQSKYSELEKVADETDRLLEEYEDYASDEAIPYGNREFKKSEIKAANRNARQALAKFLPAQAQQVQRMAMLKQAEAEYEAAIPKEIPEIAKEDSELSKKFTALREDPLIAQVKERVPDLAPQIDYILAHALRSMTMQVTPKTTVAAATQARPNVPSSPLGAAAPRSTVKPTAKAIEEATNKFEKTGSRQDFVALRTRQLSNRT